VAYYPIKEKSIEVQESLADVQTIFDNYQNTCFTQRTSEFFCLELNGEAGELANLEKKQWKGKAIDFDRFEDEAADVLIAIMNYSNAKKIDIGKAVAEKLNKIEKKRKKLEEIGEKF
jgi:NTP pyrophosphatase (non-canonical NTP hydrolase)